MLFCLLDNFVAGVLQGILFYMFFRAVLKKTISGRLVALTVASIFAHSDTYM